MAGSRKRRKPSKSSRARPVKSRRSRPRPVAVEADVFIPPGFGATTDVERVAPVNEDGDVFIPDTFGDAPPVLMDSQGGTAWMESLVEAERREFIDKDTGTPFDAEVVREYVEELERAGFDARGTCRYGCGGAMSVIGRVRPPVALHHYQCPFWESPAGRTQTPF